MSKSNNIISRDVELDEERQILKRLKEIEDKIEEHNKRFQKLLKLIEKNEESKFKK